MRPAINDNTYETIALYSWLALDMFYAWVLIYK